VAWSHGFGLNLGGDLLPAADRAAGLRARLPFSTGFGVGYRFLPWLDLRAEGKWHRFDLFDDRDGGAAGRVARYDTFTLGAGLYGHWRPWRHAADWRRGLNASTSVRFWPNVASTLDADRLTYTDARTGEARIHEVLGIGIANSPWVANISLGYAFEL
jgi:hypothetical protein